MFSICKQTQPATGIEFSICCNFFNASEKSLIVAGANILKVYRIIPDVEFNSKEKFTGRLTTIKCVKSFSNTISNFLRQPASTNEVRMFTNLRIVWQHNELTVCISNKCSKRCSTHQFPRCKTICCAT